MMLIIGYSRALRASSATSSETIWGPSDYFDLSANGVQPPAGPAWTIAMAGRALASATSQHFVGWSGANGYVRRNGGATTFRIRWRRTNGSSHASSGDVGNVSDGQLFSVLASGSRTRVTAWLNGAEVQNATLADPGLDLEAPKWLNTTNFGAGGNTARMGLRAVWIGAGYLDAAAHYASFFDGDGVPTAAMRSGAAVGGLSPRFAESGNAAKWKAYAAGKSGNFNPIDG